MSDSDECKQAHLDTDLVQPGSISQLTTSMPRLAEYNAESPCLENRCPTSRFTCTGASSNYEAARASTACSRDMSYVQYFNLSWIFFIYKKVVLGTKKNMCIGKVYTFHENTNMAAYYFGHRNMGDET